MGSSEDKIYDNIFEAFRAIAPASILLSLDSDEFQPFKSSNYYELIEMSYGSHIAVHSTFPMMLYRGENAVYDHCEASIFRNNRNKNEYDVLGIAIDELRFIEFRDIIQTLPQIKFSIEDGLNPDYTALAQHYGLNTRMVV